MNSLITTNNLNKKFNDILLFSKVSMKIGCQGFYGIKGESGSGKSSLLYVLGLLDNEYGGDVKYFDKDIKDIAKKDEFIREHIGFVFQNPIFIPEMTVEENLELVAKNKEIEFRLLLNEVGLKNKEKEKVKCLSGGERMRLALVRALLNDPDILFCDEPTGSLSPEYSRQIMDILKKESKKRTIFIVSHDEKLLFEYADYIYELKDKKIYSLKKDDKEIKPLKKNKKSSDNKLSFSFIKRYILVAFNRKRIQTLICLICLILCFFTIGFSILLKDEVSSEIKSSFETFIEKDQILVKGKEIEEKNEVKSISLTEAEDIILDSNYFYETNYFYDGNFETQFKDANYMAMLSESIVPFYDVNLRTISEAIRIDDIPTSTKIYPSMPKSLDLNEGVLGLRKKDIKKICTALNLDNLDVNALSKYLMYHSIDFCFYFQNDTWGYKNEVLFRLKAFFVVNEKIIIAHSNQRFISDFFENKLKLPYSDDLLRTEYFPWKIKRSVYIRTRKKDEYLALKEYFTSSYYKDYDLTKITGNLNSDFLSSSYHEGKYIVTYAAIGKLPFNEIEKILKEKDILEFFPTGSYYPLIEEAMVGGFKNTMFIASSRELLFEVEDYYTSIKENIDNIDISLMEFNNSISFGNLITAAKNKGFKLETKKPNLLLGRYPENENEIVISSALAKKIFGNQNICLNERIFLLYHQYDNYYFNTFQSSSCIISGIYDSDYEKIYQEEYWLPIYLAMNYSYPLEEIYINSFICKSRVDIDILSKKYLNLMFSNPLDEIYESIDSVIDMIQVILLVFTILIFVSASGILFVTIQNVMRESSKEIGLFKCLGTDKKSIFKLYLIYGSSYSLISLFITSFVIFVTYFVIRVMYFKMPFSFNVSLKPYLAILFVAIILTIPLCICQIIISLKKRTVTLLKRYY